MKLKLLGVLFVICTVCGCSDAPESGEDTVKCPDWVEADSTIQVFHSYRLENGKVRWFCDFVPTASYVSPDCHYVGVIERDCDTIALIMDDEGMYLQSSFSSPSIYKRIADNGKTLYFAVLDLRSLFLYKLDCESLEAKCLIWGVEAIRATETGFVVAKSRVSNYDTAKCIADYEYAFHDITIDFDGRVVKNDSVNEYDFDELHRRYNSDSVCLVLSQLFQ